MASFPNIEHIKGDTFKQMNFQINVNGAPLDLTNAVIRMQLKRAYNDVPRLSLTTVDNNGLTITDTEAGQFKINEQIIDINAFNYIYDIEIDNNGVVNTWVSGEFLIKPNVTE
jgi:hypothetical protein